MADTLLARHGQTKSNIDQRYAGTSQEPLTEEGREQIRRLALALVKAEVGEIWTSPIPRARESADLLAAMLAVPVRVDDRLREIGLGPWEGLTEAEVATTYPTEFAVWQTDPDRLAVPGRETLKALAERVSAAVHDASRLDRPVLLVSHVAPIRVAILTALGLPLRRYKHVPVGNAECFVLEQGTNIVRSLNGVSVVDSLKVNPGDAR